MVTRFPKNGGAACAYSNGQIDTSTCKIKDCPVDCQVSNWGSWGSCSASCGGGTQTRSRTITRQPSNGGLACPSLTESQSCNTQGCPINCAVSGWSNWSSCSGCRTNYEPRAYTYYIIQYGTSSRSRSITQYPQNGGASCPNTIETANCCDVLKNSHSACQYSFYRRLKDGVNIPCSEYGLV
jgi:hypothetical protein